jgi:V/A-type H+-transporting ATPase subunit C
MARLDYVNARLGARRARLLGPPALRELLARATLEARVELLRGWPVGSVLPAALGADPLADVERALREGWRREAADLLADVEGARPRALLQAFLALEEATAVKAVLRGVAQGLPADRTLAAAPPVPGLGEAALQAAAGAPGVESAIEALASAGSALAAPVREALGLRGEGGLLPLEIAADRAAFARARAACRGGGEDAALLLGHLEDRVDARNAASLLELAGTPAAADFFVPGGRRLDEASFRRLLGAATGEVRAALGRAFPGTDAALAAPWSADRALERALLAPLRREARRRPLSIAVPLAYLAERRAEIRRVALVLRGAALGLEGGEILDLAEA